MVGRMITEYLLKPIETDRFNATISKLKSILDRTKFYPSMPPTQNMYEVVVSNKTTASP